MSKEVPIIETTTEIKATVPPTEKSIISSPSNSPKPKGPVVEYIPQAGDIQTDINTGATSIYIEGQGFVPMNEGEDGNDD